MVIAQSSLEPTPPMEAAVAPAQPLWVSVLRMMADPTAVLRSRLQEIALPWVFAVSGSAFALFFLQTGLDLARADRASGGKVLLLTAEGALCGTIGVVAIAWVAWTLCRMFGGTRPLPWVVRAFALGYSPALVYATFGIVANLALGWNTAVAFGVTGVLWALGPMTAAIKLMMGPRLVVAAAIVTLCGGALLFTWGLLGTGSIG